MTRSKIAAAVVALALSAGSALAEGQTHYLALHIDQGDPEVFNEALTNAENVSDYYRERGDSVVIEVVVYGPGLTMLIEGESPVETRIAAMSLELDDITFTACGNTLHAMERRLGHEVPLVSEAVVVQAGVARLIELQEQGYAYVRP